MNAEILKIEVVFLLMRQTFTNISNDFNKLEISFKESLASLLYKTCLTFNWLNPKSLIGDYCIEIRILNLREHWAGFLLGTEPQRGGHWGAAVLSHQSEPWFCNLPCQSLCTTSCGMECASCTDPNWRPIEAVSAPRAFSCRRGDAVTLSQGNK